MEPSPEMIALAILQTPGAPVRAANGRAGNVLRRAKATAKGARVVVAWQGHGATTVPISTLTLDRGALAEAVQRLADTGGAYSAIFGALADLDALDARSEAAQHTDTGEVWEVVNSVRDDLRRVLPILEVVRNATAAGDLWYSQADHDIAEGTSAALTAILA